MSRIPAHVFALLILLSTVVPARAQEAAPTRPTLTVADFVTDRTGWMPPPHFGETLAELLTGRLVAGGQFRTVDREWLRSTAASDRSRTPFAELLDRAMSAGVDYLVAGSVTRLSIERHSSTGVGLLPVVGGGFVRRNQTESVIGLTIRLIDVRTGEVVAATTVERGATQEARAGGGVAVIGPVPILGGGGSSAIGFQDRLLDEALQEAVTVAAGTILAAAPHLLRK
jgi:curli biogenesis system outer membrane secretion channel CsgG